MFVYYGHDTNEWITNSSRTHTPKRHSLLAVQCGKNLPIINRPFGRIDMSFHLTHSFFLITEQTKFPAYRWVLRHWHTHIQRRNPFHYKPWQPQSFLKLSSNRHNRRVYRMKIIPTLCQHIRPQSVRVYATAASFLPNQTQLTEIFPLFTPQRDTHSHRAQCAFHCSYRAFQRTPSRVKIKGSDNAMAYSSFLWHPGQKRKWGESLGTHTVQWLAR